MALFEWLFGFLLELAAKLVIALLVEGMKEARKSGFDDDDYTG